MACLPHGLASTAHSSMSKESNTHIVIHLNRKKKKNSRSSVMTFMGYTLPWS